MSEMSQEEMIAKQKEQCPFCKIASGEIPSFKVYEDDAVIAITDINPLKQGHVLVMPKEHYPIMPMMPPEIFKKVFSVVKYISKGIKDAVVTESDVVFIANGGVAGQQSPHFLFHIIPREKGDGITNFNYTKKEIDSEKSAQLEQVLKANIENFLKDIAVRSTPIENNEVAKNQPEQILQKKEEPKPSAEQKKKLAAYLEENEEIRNLLLTNVDGLKKKIASDSALSELFLGVDLDILSKKLNEAYNE